MHPSESDKNKHEKALRLAVEIVAGDVRSLPVTPVDGVCTIRQPQRRLSATEAAQVAEQYRAGASTYQLAAEWKINRATVTLALERAAVPIRKPRLSASQLEEAAHLSASGWSLNRLGRKFGVDPKTMKRRLAENLT